MHRCSPVVRVLGGKARLRVGLLAAVGWGPTGRVASAAAMRPPTVGRSQRAAAPPLACCVTGLSQRAATHLPAGRIVQGGGCGAKRPGPSDGDACTRLCPACALQSQPVCQSSRSHVRLPPCFDTHSAPRPASTTEVPGTRRHSRSSSTARNHVHPVMHPRP